jgi:ubiquinone/menaquinone biosynthesis C-methylase UbiE
MSKMSERRYRRKGLDENQQHIVQALESLGLKGASLLEVGCGVGVLHQTLLEKGAANAIGIDLAPRMLELAENRAVERQLSQRTEYRAGDFGELSNHMWNFGLWLFRSDFRGFVHDPQLVQQSIEELGFRRVFNRDSRMWHTQVFVADP